MLEQLWYYLTHKNVHTFPENLFQEVNQIARREFKLILFDDTVEYFIHYATLIFPQKFRSRGLFTSMVVLMLDIYPSSW